MSAKKIKKPLITLGCVILGILLLPLILTVMLIAALYTPIDYLRFRYSRLRRDTGHSYQWLITTSAVYRIHRIITNECLPIEYHKDSESDGTTGFFTAGKCLLVYDFEAGSVWLDECNGWMAIHNGVRASVNEHLRAEMDKFEKKHGIHPEKAVAMYSRLNFNKLQSLSEEEQNALAGKAEESGLFLLYDGKRALYEALCEFAKDNVKTAESCDKK